MIDELRIKGGNRLQGEVHIDGSKNAVLPILAATLLPTSGKSVLTNVPRLDDVATITQVLEHLNVEVDSKLEDNTVTLDASGNINSMAHYDFVSKMRASVLVMGPLLARNKHAHVAMPGGCAIGSRPIDLHLKGFEALGANITIGNGYIEGVVEDELKGADIYLDFPSVGATQNIMMAAVLAKGKTVIDNAAQEPEIVDLANFLNSMGASIKGAGTATIRIKGVEELNGVKHSIIPDRIEAGTFMVAAAITRGDVLVKNVIHEHLRPVTSKLREMGAEVTLNGDSIRVNAIDKTLQAVTIKTKEHPGFPTDMQAQMMALMLTTEGVGHITETIFENRFMHVEEFKRMNAIISVEAKTAAISNSKLSGAQVKATDLRAAAALALAGLVADGYTRVGELKHLDRGYVDFDYKLQSLGADIVRTSRQKYQNVTSMN
ncbi:UDP-N-acetylglucosamine 1-carboxyvinyltransferase [Abyssicoccus albus]